MSASVIPGFLLIQISAHPLAGSMPYVYGKWQKLFPAVWYCFAPAINSKETLSDLKCSKERASIPQKAIKTLLVRCYCAIS